MLIGRIRLTAATAAALLVCGGIAVNGDTFDKSEFHKTHSFIKPDPETSRWEKIPWHVDLWKARREAARQGKPLYLWTAGGAPPIGGC